MSGVDLNDGHMLRKGAASSVAEWVRSEGGQVPTELGDIVDGISAAGGTPLVVGQVVDGTASVLGVIHLKDVVKQGMRERFDEMRRMGIRTVMITGDNPLTAKAIADEAGVDDFLAEATPEDKMALIKKEQAGGKLVAMTGDGTNDAPALAQADVGVAMNTGTSAAKEAGNMVDLDSDPTKLIEIVEIGKQLLITRGALTTFSIANDIAKYFAIIPAMFVALFPGLDLLNVMRLHSPQSAILSAVIFNAVVIVALIPLSLRGRPIRQAAASKLSSRNLYIYGLAAHRAVHRDQTDRPRHPILAEECENENLKFGSPTLGRIADAAGPHGHLGPRLPGVDLARRHRYPACGPTPTVRSSRPMESRWAAASSGNRSPTRTATPCPHFQRRLSASGDGYDPLATSASNLGPESIVDTPGDPSPPKDDNGAKASLLTLVCSRSAAE